jgi:hypothetical protein
MSEFSGSNACPPAVIYSPIVLDEGKGFEGTQRATAQVVEEEADRVGSQLGLDTGTLLARLRSIWICSAS